MQHQPEIQYPQTQVQVAHNGIAIITLYSPFHMTTTILEPQVIREIIKAWKNQELEQNTMLDIAKRVKAKQA